MTCFKEKKDSNCGQDAIWTYYQNKCAEEFYGARPRMEYLIKQIKKRFPNRVPCLLNVGAGNGDFEKMALSYEWDIHSIDPDETAVKRLNQIGIKAFQGHIENLVFKSDLFNIIVASEVLEHLTAEQFNLGIAEVKRVLKPGGWFIGTVPYRENLNLNKVYCPNCHCVFHRWGHERSFDLKTLQDALGLFFDIVNVRRTAFISFHRRSLLGAIKGMTRIILAKFGSEIAIPSIFFMARKGNK